LKPGSIPNILHQKEKREGGEEGEDEEICWKEPGKICNDLSLSEALPFEIC